MISAAIAFLIGVVATVLLNRTRWAIVPMGQPPGFEPHLLTQPCPKCGRPPLLGAANTLTEREARQEITALMCHAVNVLLDSAKAQNVDMDDELRAGFVKVAGDCFDMGLACEERGDRRTTS